MITCKITTRPRADGGLFFQPVGGWRLYAVRVDKKFLAPGEIREPEDGPLRGPRRAPAPCQGRAERAIKKVPGQCANTPPAGTAHERTLLSYTVVLLSMFRPRRMPPDGGLCFVLHSGRSPEYQTKERQQRQDDKASHAAWPPSPATELALCRARGGQPRSERVVACRTEKNKQALAGRWWPRKRKTPYRLLSVRG